MQIYSMHACLYTWMYCTLVNYIYDAHGQPVYNTLLCLLLIASPILLFIPITSPLFLKKKQKQKLMKHLLSLLVMYKL